MDDRSETLVRVVRFDRIRALRRCHLGEPVDRRRAAIAALIPLVTFLGFAAIRVASQPKLNFDEHIFLDVGRHILDTGLPLRAYAQPGDRGSSSTTRRCTSTSSPC